VSDRRPLAPDDDGIATSADRYPPADAGGTTTGEGAAPTDVGGTTTGDAAITVYRKLLARYHRSLDLVSPQAYADIDRHLAEAERYAVALRELADPAGAVLDLGSGAGLPGVVVAARLAPREVWWVERRRRRATFLTQVAAHAGLDGVRVFAEDVGRLARPDPGVAAVTAQAVGTLVDVAALTQHLWGARVVVISRKGPDWPAEVDALTAWWRRRRGAAEGRGPVVLDELGGETMAQDGSAVPRVLRAEPLSTRGTLIAVELRGG
jgi:16S rRNA (guanine527-N7)-methyltransferase